jgi:hypothetical protein
MKQVTKQIPQDWDKGTFLQKLLYLINEFKYSQPEAEILANLTREKVIKAIQSK